MIDLETPILKKSKKKTKEQRKRNKKRSKTTTVLHFQHKLHTRICDLDFFFATCKEALRMKHLIEEKITLRCG